MSAGLAALFERVAVKRLSLVEASHAHSNQHEFNGVSGLKELFGTTSSHRRARFVYLGDREEDTVSADGLLTWYDARENHPTRSEFRLYYTPTPASDSIQAGDAAFFIIRPDETVLVVFARQHSTSEEQMLWLFRVHAPGHQPQVRQVGDDNREIGFAVRGVLETLGIELPSAPVPEESAYDMLVTRYGSGFPSTAEFSAFARELTEDVSPLEDPDGALVGWLEREEALFRHLERHLLKERLRMGFAEDVDAFLAFSLSVQNRRKARAGRALENHVEALLQMHQIPHDRGRVTEGTSKPDFIFPSAASYRDSHFPASALRMLAVKSTCKDRWRQILAEAERIPTKHLLTLEPSISVAQTEEMLSRSVVLVLPRALHETYTPSQQSELLTVTRFLEGLQG